MPKTVDHALRRHDLGEALWRVAEREGMPGVSVRSVAAEAGISPGSLRYYFSSQADLILFAMELLVERATNRITALIEAIGEGEDPGDWLTDLFKEGLPLDAQRRVEIDVWSAFMEQARTDPLLLPARQMEWSASQMLCRTAVVNLRSLSIQTTPDTPLEGPLEAEASLLHAVWDGLVNQLSVFPETEREALADRLLRLHLTGIRERGQAGECLSGVSGAP